MPISAETVPFRLTGGALLKILFGYTPSGVDDEFIRNGEVALDVFSNATSPGWVVDIIPACAAFLSY